MNRDDLTPEQDAAFRKGYEAHAALKMAPDDPYGRAGWDEYAREQKLKADAAMANFKLPWGRSW